MAKQQDQSYWNIDWLETFEFVASMVIYTHCGVLSHAHTDIYTCSKATRTPYLISQFCRISCSRGESMMVLRGGWCRWKWLKPGKDNEPMIWIYGHLFTLIALEVYVVRGEKTWWILTVLVSSTVTSLWGKQLKVVDHWRCVFEQNKKVWIVVPGTIKLRLLRAKKG